MNPTEFDNFKSLVTVDGAPASYWEHIVAVTDDGCEVLDLRAGEKAVWGSQPLSEI